MRPVEQWEITVMKFLRQRAWSPYVVGALIGVLSWFAFVSADKPLGASTTFVRAVGFGESAVAAEHIRENAYFTKTKIKVDWQMMLVGGIFLGALISSWFSGDRQTETVPALWRKRFGQSKALRYGAAFGGGVLLLFGARLAGGCTSGHGISGALQLALSGWVFFIAVFAAGVATALTLYGKVRNDV
jgi:hypothetical protein